MRFQIHMPSIPSGKFTRRLFLFVIATMLAFCHGTYHAERNPGVDGRSLGNLIEGGAGWLWP